MPDPTCLSCQIVGGARETPGGAILETAHFHVHQDFAYDIPGFVIVASRRHVRAFDELTDAEAAEYGQVVRRIRHAQREVLGIGCVYYFNHEDTGGHFHEWLLPRHAWMEPFGRSVESVRPALDHVRTHRSSDAERGATLRAVEGLRRALGGPA